VALVDGEGATVGRFTRQGSRVRLQGGCRPAALVPAERIQIHGVVVGVIRHY
jgi:SOS-response transcriptional repressor LexA